MEKSNLVEIKNGEIGTGLLIEHDGYISSECGENKKLFEEINSESDGGEFHCPYPFVVSAVLQKFGIENANGRIYPENILKREAERYLEKIKEKMAIGECYRPEAMILTEKGWKHLYEVSEGENILTLNTETNNIEIKPIKSITKYAYDGNMINIKGAQINDVVTPDHGFPLYGKTNKFKKFVTAKELMENDGFSHFYIPKTGNWIGRNDEFITIPKVNESEIGHNIGRDLREKYTTDLVIPMDVFAKFMGIYLSVGSHSKKDSKSSYKINIRQKEESVCVEIEKMLTDWDIKFSISNSKTGPKTFVISDMRLCKYVQQFGLCYDKFVPEILKSQSKETLMAFYDWFVMGDGSVRGDKRCKSDDVFSDSKRLALDLNEIQLKIGYSGTFSEDDGQYDRKKEDKAIKAENSNKLYFTYKSLTKGIYADKRFMKIDEVYYKGDVMCVEVDNHVWYAMDNNRCHWTKNCNHPSDSVIDLSRVAMNVLEMHWEGHTLVGKIEIITSPGFRKHGIITCQGDQIANLILQGIKVGVSSRGLGTVTNKMGVLYVSDDFELVCFDIVSSPSTPGAYISTKMSNLQQYIEGKETEKNSIIEKKIEKFENWLNG